MGFSGLIEIRPSVNLSTRKLGLCSSLYFYIPILSAPLQSWYFLFIQVSLFWVAEDSMRYIKDFCLHMGKGNLTVMGRVKKNCCEYSGRVTRREWILKMLEFNDRQISSSTFSPQNQMKTLLKSYVWFLGGYIHSSSVLAKPFQFHLLFIFFKNSFNTFSVFIIFRSRWLIFADWYHLQASSFFL